MGLLNSSRTKSKLHLKKNLKKPTQTNILEYKTDMEGIKKGYWERN